jgi:uncharacterized protein YraI
MDELIGFLFGAVIFIGIVFFILSGVTTALVNLYVFLDPLLAGWGALSAPVSWGITTGVFVAIMHFACSSGRVLQRPGLRGGLFTLAFAWLGAVWWLGDSLVVDGAQTTPFIIEPPGQRDATPVVADPPEESHPAIVPGTPANRPNQLHETAYVEAAKLNVRRGPGLNYEVLDGLNKGALVRILARETASDGQVWARIRAGSTEGWTNEAHLKTGGSSVRRQTRGALQPGSTARVDAIRANLRGGPGVSAGVIGTLNQGTVVRVLQRKLLPDDAVWVRVESGSLRGWMSAPLLRAEPW